MELLRYFIVFCLFLYAEAKSVHYDYEFDEDAKVWFKLHRIKATWHEARKMCNMEGAILASPLNKPIIDALDAYSRAYDIDQIFVGVHATFSDLWHTIEGVSLEKLTDDLDISKINSGNDHCSVLSAGSLISVKCSEMYPYMCYKKENSDIQLTSCGTTDKEYILDERTGHCYKFHAYGRTWWDAFKTCSAEEAYMAIVNSDTEAQVIKDIFNKYPDSAIHADFKDVAGIGIVDWEHNREWYTIHGELLEDSGYTKWNKGEPNNAAGNEYCGTMLRNGFLNDDPCSRKTAFICEKDVGNTDSSEDKTEVSNPKTTGEMIEIRTSTSGETIEIRASTSEESNKITVWTTNKTAEITTLTSENISGAESSSTSETIPDSLLYDMFGEDLP